MFYMFCIWSQWQFSRLKLVLLWSRGLSSNWDLCYAAVKLPMMNCPLQVGAVVSWTVWLGGIVVRRRISDREVVRFLAVPLPSATLGKLFTHVCLCSPSSINWHRLRLGVKCTTGAVLGMLATIWQTLRLAANWRHSSIVLTCGCHCKATLVWLLSCNITV